MPEDFSIDYPVNSDPVFIDYSNDFWLGNSDAVVALCGEISYSVTGIGGEAAIVDQYPESKQLRIYSSDIENMIGQSFPVVIESTLQDYTGEISGDDMKITVNFVNCTVAKNDVVMPELDDMEFVIGDDAMQVPFKHFQSPDATTCNYSWTYSIHSAADPVGGADISAYVTLQEDQTVLLVHAD